MDFCKPYMLSDILREKNKKKTGRSIFQPAVQCIYLRSKYMNFSDRWISRS
jgi:hypothetical protein